MKKNKSTHGMDELQNLIKMIRSIKALNVDNNDMLPVLFKKEEIDLLLYFLSELTLYKEV